MTWTEVGPLWDAPQPQHYWPSFSVGDRVRLAANGECPDHSELSVALDGEVGTVVRIMPDDDHGHPYQVRIDRVELLPAAWMADFGPWCAAPELELVEFSQ